MKTVPRGKPETTNWSSQLANKLSRFRMSIVAWAALAVLGELTQWRIVQAVALTLTTLCLLSDSFDGAWARYTGTTSEYGDWLDSRADLFCRYSLCYSALIVALFNNWMIIFVIGLVQWLVWLLRTIILRWTALTLRALQNSQETPSMWCEPSWVIKVHTANDFAAGCFVLWLPLVLPHWPSANTVACAVLAPTTVLVIAFGWQNVRQFKQFAKLRGEFVPLTAIRQ